MIRTTETLEHFSEFFGMDFAAELNFKPPKMPKLNNAMVFNDVHAPFEKESALEEVLKKKADRAIIVGDWFDMFAMSHFKKRVNPPIDFKWEFKEAYLKLIKVCKHFPVVYLMLTNHDMRWDKYIYDHATPDILPFCRTGILRELLKLIPNLEIVGQKNGREINYAWQYKDVLFTHAEKSAMQDSKILEDIERYMHSWREVYKLKPYNAIIQAHNHRAAYMNFSGKHCYLAPCMIDIDKTAFDYVFDGKIRGKPPVIGYMEIGFTNDKFDFAKTRTVIL